MKEADSTKAAVTVAEMARMVGLSRARFYQLIHAGVFPEPERQADNGRPFFGENRQKECLEVRRRNYGVNGKAVLFYARRLRPVLSPPKPRTPVTAAASKVGTHDVHLEAVKALGLTTATPGQVSTAVAEVYPNGTAGVVEGEVIRTVFLHLMRRDSGDSVGR
jgi:hypothetical protein